MHIGLAGMRVRYALISIHIVSVFDVVLFNPYQSLGQFELTRSSLTSSFTYPSRIIVTIYDFYNSDAVCEKMHILNSHSIHLTQRCFLYACSQQHANIKEGEEIKDP